MWNPTNNGKNRSKPWGKTDDLQYQEKPFSRIGNMKVFLKSIRILSKTNLQNSGKIVAKAYNLFKK